MTCAKVTVTAILLCTNGETYVGTNACTYPQPVCPRTPGEGYAKCDTICGQLSHAEVEALDKAGDDARGGTMYVDYYYVCDQCAAACREAGVINIITTGVPPA